MAGEKIKMKRIADAAARQVTFAKRRRGLFKTAEELSILCGADVALVVFSSTGKLYDYSSSSMNIILDKYISYSSTSQNDGQPNLEVKFQDVNKLKQRIEDISQYLRKMHGEDGEGLSLKDLLQLEEQLNMGLSQVRSQKEEYLLKEISELKEKVIRRVEENTELHRQIKEGYGFHVENNDLHSSASITSNSFNFKLHKSPIEEYEDSDTSLQLGLTSQSKI